MSRRRSCQELSGQRKPNRPARVLTSVWYAASICARTPSRRLLAERVPPPSHRHRACAIRAPELECYLVIVGYMSQVFDEERDASTFPLAQNILLVNRNRGAMTEIFDRQLLAIWLNFANGSIEYDELFDTDGDRTPDTAFFEAVAAAEAVRLDPGATSAELRQQKDFLEGLATGRFGLVGSWGYYMSL